MKPGGLLGRSGRGTETGEQFHASNFLNIRSISFLAVVFGVVLLCFIWGGLYLKIQSERQVELDGAKRETANYSRVFEEHIARTIRGLDDVALFLKYKAEKEGLNIDLPLLLKEGRFAGQPFVQLGIADKNGRVVSSLITPPAQIGISDLEHFTIHQQADTGKLFVAKPIIGRISGKWSMQLSRRINGPDGSFGGVVVVAVNPYYFADFYKQVNLGPGSNISLIGKDGILRVRQSDDEVSFGLNFSRRVDGEMSKGDSGTYIDKGIVDGVNRVFSYRIIKDYPLIVAVGVSEDSALSDLNQRITSYYWACGTMSAVIVLFIGALLRAIVRRKKTESALKSREEKLQDIIAGTHAGTWEWNVQTGHTAYNERWAEIVGYTLAELEPVSIETWKILVHPDDLAVSGLLLQDHLGGKSPLYKCDSRMRHKDGYWVWVYDTGKITRWDVDGKPLLMSGIHLDISQRKDAEQELAANRARYQALLDQSFDAVAIYSIDTQEVLEVNEKFSELFGYSLPADSPLFVADFVADKPEAIDHYLEILRAQNHVTPAYRRFRHKSGRVIDVERTATVIRIDDTELVMSTIRELTPERRREREIARDARHARRVQEGLLPSVRSTPDVDVWTMNRPSHVVSGDLYHLAWNEDKTVLRGYLADVSGHGLATAIQTAAINVLLHEVSALPLTLASQMAWINRRVSQYFAEDAFAAAIGFELDLYAGEMRYVSAGITEFYHNARRIIAPGLMLGIKTEGDFGSGTISFETGDIFAFLTDGLTDVFSREDWASQNGKFDALTAWIEKTAKGESVRDDATALCFCIKRLSKTVSGKTGWPQHLRLRGYADYWRLRPKVTHWLSTLTGQKHSKVEVAVQEAIVNALECKDAECRNHEAIVKINVVGRRLVVRVATNRLGFPGNSFLRRMRGQPEDVFESSVSENMGRGLPLMFSLSERITYNASGTEVLMAWKMPG